MWRHIEDNSFTKYKKCELFQNLNWAQDSRLIVTLQRLLSLSSDSVEGKQFQERKICNQLDLNSNSLSFL